LLVEDEPDIVYLVKAGLERDGFEVDGYTDPILALQNFKSGLYQLLVLDIKMPWMDGIELFHRMNKEDDKVRVCFFSASQLLNSDYQNFIQKYPNRFLFVPKPISIHKMTEQIERFLST
jgi:two-component system, OmpR family, response regulator ChvI